MVPFDLAMEPAERTLLVSGPNTGGKTVLLKAVGIISAMAQAGIPAPVDEESTIPMFDDIYADVGDEQSIEASLSTFSGHMTNIASMERDFALPALILLDEVGSGTDPLEGGALGMAIVDHFRKRGALVLATTHDDTMKSYGATTDGVKVAAFGFELMNSAQRSFHLPGMPWFGRPLPFHTHQTNPQTMPSASITAVSTRRNASRCRRAGRRG